LENDHRIIEIGEEARTRQKMEEIMKQMNQDLGASEMTKEQLDKVKV